MARRSRTAVSGTPSPPTRLRALRERVRLPPLAREATTDRSLRHAVWDGVTVSAMAGMAEGYFSAFAVLLKATTAQVGLLASLPPLAATMAQVFSVWLGRHVRSRKSIIVGGALLQVATFVPLALLPLLLPEELAVTALLACATVYFIGPNLGSPQWGSLMGDLVPEQRRGRFFALRTQWSSVASFAALVAGGIVLHAFATTGVAYRGFVTIFGFAALLRMRSVWHLSRMLEPPRREPATAAGDGIRALLRWPGLPRFLRFSGFYACMQFTVSIASPFFVVHMLRDLEYSYLQLMANSAVSVCFQFLTLNRWGRLSDVFGNRVVLRATGFMIPFTPALWLVSSDFCWLLCAQAIGGIAWAGYALSASNSIYELTAPAQRASCMALHGVLAATAVFAGASLGGFLATELPATWSLAGHGVHWPWVLHGVFLLSSLARLTVACAFLPHLREQRRVRRASMTGVIFAVTRITAVSGLLFDLVGTFRRRDGDGRRD
jgi:MFS family permease